LELEKDSLSESDDEISDDFHYLVYNIINMISEDLNEALILSWIK